LKIGICKECFENVPLTPRNQIEDTIYECPSCDYPNGIKCGDFWEIYNSNPIIQGFYDLFSGEGIARR
jgi:hypothetical protein